MNSRIKAGFFIALLAAFFAAPPAAAHNYHTSLTRIDYNAGEKSLEIEINLFNHDLENVLAAENKRRVDLEKSKNVEQMLFDYLRKNFLIAGEGVEKLNWVGMEMKADMTTAFVEITEIEAADDLKIKNKIFFESFKDQTNLVSFHNGAKKNDFVFKVGDEFKKLFVEN